MSRTEILRQYEELVINTHIADMGRNREAMSLAIAEQMNFRQLHNITIPEMTAWTKHNVKRAESVSHAVQLLSRSA